MFGQIIGQNSSGFLWAYRCFGLYLFSGQNRGVLAKTGVFWPKQANYGQEKPHFHLSLFSFMCTKTLSIGQKSLILAKTISFGQNKVYRPNNRYRPKLGFWKVDYLISVFRLKISIGRPLQLSFRNCVYLCFQCPVSKAKGKCWRQIQNYRFKGRGLS